MNIFQLIRDNLEAKDIAYKYLGSPAKIVGNRLWYNSPFRQEKIPSFMVTDSFHDFGEGWHGDGIDLISKLCHTSPLDSAKIIAKDFNLDYENEYQSKYLEEILRKEREAREKAKQELEKWFIDTYKKLCDKYNLLSYGLKHTNPVCKCYLQSEVDYIEYIMDKYISAKSTEEKLEIYKGREIIERWI